MTPLRGRLSAAAALGAAAAIGLAAGASAAPSAFITVRVGDEVSLAGSRVLCVVTRGSRDQPVIACFKADAKGPLPRSFGAGIDSFAKVVAFRFDTKRAPSEVYTRRPQAHRASVAAARRVLLQVGQVIRVAGTTLDCAVVRSGAGAGIPTIYCAKDDATGPIPGTYALLVSDTTVSVGKVGKDRRTTITFLRRH